MLAGIVDHALTIEQIPGVAIGNIGIVCDKRVAKDQGDADRKEDQREESEKRMSEFQAASYESGRRTQGSRRMCPLS
jgi:hypothetical protein